MRVLLITGSFPPMACGVGDYSQKLARALAGCEGVEVAVLTGAEGGAGQGIERYATFPVMRDWTLGEAGQVRSVVRTWKPDIVHLQYPTQGYRNNLPCLLPLLLRMSGLPVVQTWHEYYPILCPEWRGAVLNLTAGRVIVVRPAYDEHRPLWLQRLKRPRRFDLIPSAPSIPRVALAPQERREVADRFAPGRSLLVFFGFPFEHKGIDDILLAMDEARHHLLVVGRIDASDPYQRALELRARAPGRRAGFTLAGFLEPLEVARVLAAAEAVVLPFRAGGGEWNTSLQAAVQQGTFVLTTSLTEHGYDRGRNTYYARPRDIDDLRAGLTRHLGSRGSGPGGGPNLLEWGEVALRHLAVYREIL